MKVEFRLPQLSESMTTATLVAWLKGEGDEVSVGEPLCEVETEKSNVDLPSEHEGRLVRILVPAGTNDIPVGTVLAQLEVAEIGKSPMTQNRSQAQVEHAESAEPTPQLQAAASGGPAARAIHDHDAVCAEDSATEPRVTPLARRIAANAGIDLAEIRGSGPRGRIVRRDVERAIAVRSDAANLDAAPSSGGAAPAARPPHASSKPAVRHLGVADRQAVRRPIELPRIRRVAAERLAESKRTVPHFYLRRDCRVDRLLELREELKQDVSGLTVTHLVVRAVGRALRDVAEANVVWRDGGLFALGCVDVGIAVACDDGLLTPVIRRVDGRPLAELVREALRMTEAARDGRLAPADYDGGACTVSNLGMYDVDELYPIINPVQSSIVGVGAVRERPIVRHGELAVARVLTLTLAADHRAFDGVTGARFLGRIAEAIERPLTLLL